MKAVGVFPQRRTVELVSFDEPKITSPEQVKIRVMQVGVCGTDREICDFEYGTPPEGSEYLVLGHESLGEVVEAADTVQIGALRRDALGAVDELKAKGSDSRRDISFWGQVGVGAVALGCVSAAALGQIAIGIPCVIGGSASQGLLSFWEKQQ